MFPLLLEKCHKQITKYVFQFLHTFTSLLIPTKKNKPFVLRKNKQKSVVISTMSKLAFQRKGIRGFCYNNNEKEEEEEETARCIL